MPPDATLAPAPAPAPAPATALAPSSAIRLRVLLCATSGLAEEAVHEATALGPDAAGETVAAVIDAYLSRPGPVSEGRTVRAIQLARELDLAAAIPALVRCVDAATPPTAVARAAHATLVHFGTRSVDGLLEALARCTAPGARAGLADALSRIPSHDGRVRAALVRLLDDDPFAAARALAEHGAWRAVPDVLRTFDRLAAAPVSRCCRACALDDLALLERTVEELGGRLSPDRVAAMAALEDGDVHGFALDGPAGDAPRLPIRVAPRPGRNDPCPCGSGKKYKRCHLEADRREARRRKAGE